jgi:hypothetical protein
MSHVLLIAGTLLSAGTSGTSFLRDAFICLIKVKSLVSATFGWTKTTEGWPNENPGAFAYQSKVEIINATEKRPMPIPK